MSETEKGLKILVDENMPYARDLFSRLGEVTAVPGRPIPVAQLADADALMVRSVTKKSLLMKICLMPATYLAVWVR